jgi:NTE family protein
MSDTAEAAPRTGLILSGGGARAAYQVGVLKAIDELLAEPERNPFTILCGTSAGAINAVSLAVHCRNFHAAVKHMVSIWENFHVDQVYRSDVLGVAASGAHWLTALAVGWLFRISPRSLLDNSPLQKMLEQSLDFSKIDAAIADGALYALSVTASGYSSGESVTFCQGGPKEGWQRTQRVGCQTRIGIEHLMASSAIPFFFPAARIHREYFGDGSMRQLAPVSPAIHLGANRVLVIGVGRMNEPRERTLSENYPTLAQIAGHALSSIFLDSMAADVERMQRINKTISLIPAGVRDPASNVALRQVDVLVISPSQRLDHIAAKYAKSLPWTIRYLLGGIGATSRRGAALLSYLLFEQPYTHALMELGYHDTMVRRDEVMAFLDATPVSSAALH